MDAVSIAEVVIVPVVVLGELEAGFRGGSRYRENVRVLEEFLDEPFVSVAKVHETTARRYGEIFKRLRAAGSPIPANDMWIAATTLDEAGHLLTFDRDFERVENLQVTVLRNGG